MTNISSLITHTYKMPNKNKINKKNLNHNGRKLSTIEKESIAGKQYYKCANKPESNLKGLENYQCPLWKNANTDTKGSFDESGYKIDHVTKHCLTKDDCDNNLQALCIACHSVKKERFLMK